MPNVEDADTAVACVELLAGRVEVWFWAIGVVDDWFANSSGKESVEEEVVLVLAFIVVEEIVSSNEIDDVVCDICVLDEALELVALNAAAVEVDSVAAVEEAMVNVEVEVVAVVVVEAAASCDVLGLF